MCSNFNGLHASSAQDCPVWKKEKVIQRVRIEKRISFPEARQLVEAKMPTVVSGGKSHSTAASARKEMETVECQTSLTWVFSDRPLRTTRSSVRTSGGPGSVSAGTLASSGKSRPASADARVPCESAKCSEFDKCSADPSKTASMGSADPPKTASKGSAGPSNTAPKGKPSRTAPSKDDSSSSSGSPTGVMVEGVLVDDEWFVQPRRSAPSGRSHAPPKQITSDRQKKAEQNPVLSNQYTALSDDEMDSSSILTEAMEQSIVQVKEAKFLGHIFDTKLTFKNHIQYLKSSFQKALDIIMRIVGHTDWGADRTVLLRLCRALVRSKLEYGCIVYGSARRSVLKQLDPVHHQGLRIALGGFPHISSSKSLREGT